MKWRQASGPVFVCIDASPELPYCHEPAQRAGLTFDIRTPRIEKGACPPWIEYSARYRSPTITSPHRSATSKRRAERCGTRPMSPSRGCSTSSCDGARTGSASSAHAGHSSTRNGASLSTRIRSRGGTRHVGCARKSSAVEHRSSRHRHRACNDHALRALLLPSSNHLVGLTAAGWFRRGAAPRCPRGFVVPLLRCHLPHHHHD